MNDPELKTLRLHAPLRYRKISRAYENAAPFLERGAPADGDDVVAFFDPDSVIRFDPSDGPRAVDRLPAPLALADNAAGGSSSAQPGSELELERGAYGFLQGRASTEGELSRLLEGFARQTWWERLDCQGPYIARRVFEDGRWATQIWRRLLKGSL